MQPPGGGAKQGALWVGVNHAINSTAREAVEQTGAKLRAMMPWIGKNKLVDKSRN